MLEELRKAVWEANMELPRRNLVTYTWGNVSGIDREKGLIVIKPSGVEYEDLTPEKLVIVDLDNNIVEGNLNPSSDTKTHVELYRAFPTLGGIVHTHSPHAVAWAQAGRDIPCYGTTHADYFYGPVPCARSLTAEEVEEDYERNTGKVIIETFTERGLDPKAVPGVICRNHGPFTWGKDAAQAVYHAVVLEEVAKMAMYTITIDPNTPSAPQHVQDKHYMRKTRTKGKDGGDKQEVGSIAARQMNEMTVRVRLHPSVNHFGRSAGNSPDIPRCSRFLQVGKQQILMHGDELVAVPRQQAFLHQCVVVFDIFKHVFMPEQGNPSAPLARCLFPLPVFLSARFIMPEYGIHIHPLRGPVLLRPRGKAVLKTGKEDFGGQLLIEIFHVQKQLTPIAVHGGRHRPALPNQACRLLSAEGERGQRLLLRDLLELCAVLLSNDRLHASSSQAIRTPLHASVSVSVPSQASFSPSNRAWLSRRVSPCTLLAYRAGIRCG